MRNLRKMNRRLLLLCFLCIVRTGSCFPSESEAGSHPKLLSFSLPANSRIARSSGNDSSLDFDGRIRNTEQVRFEEARRQVDVSDRTSINAEKGSTCYGPTNEEGRCEYLGQCFHEEYRSNFALVTDHMCTIDHMYVGVCCSNPTGEDDSSSDKDSLADELPIIAAPADDPEITQDSSRIIWPGGAGSNSGSSSKPQNEETKDSRRTRGCGTTARSKTRLVGGQPADPSEWPWMVALLRSDTNQYCGGVLITDRHVLTAAHCVYRSRPREIRVRLGEYDFSTSEETISQDFAVTEIRVHRDFDYTSYENDIAILKIHRPTIFNSYIWPVCLPPIEQTFENKSAIVTGWGTRYYGGPASTVLMEVAVPIWPQEKCARSFTQRIPSTTMCAAGYEGGRDACQGDSGGPLLHQLGNGRWVNVGIVSWGIRCGEPGRPGIYTRVNSYLDWIFANAVF